MCGRPIASGDAGTAGAELKPITGETVRVLEARLHVLHELEARRDRDLGVISLTRGDCREIGVLARHIAYVRPVRPVR